MSGVIIPNRYVKVVDPLIFLAGPIRGAPNWQDEAIFILTRSPQITIASPRRGIRDKIAKYVLTGDELILKGKELGKDIIWI